MEGAAGGWRSGTPKNGTMKRVPCPFGDSWGRREGRRTPGREANPRTCGDSVRGTLSRRRDLTLPTGGIDDGGRRPGASRRSCPGRNAAPLSAPGSPCPGRDGSGRGGSREGSLTGRTEIEHLKRAPTVAPDMRSAPTSRVSDCAADRSGPRRCPTPGLRGVLDETELPDSGDALRVCGAGDGAGADGADQSDDGPLLHGRTGEGRLGANRAASRRMKDHASGAGESADANRVSEQELTARYHPKLLSHGRCHQRRAAAGDEYGRGPGTRPSWGSLLSPGPRYCSASVETGVPRLRGV